MNFAYLKQQLSGILQDPTYTDTWLGIEINKAIQQIAGEVLCPALETKDSVSCEAGTFETALPENYKRNLHAAWTNQGNLEVYSSLNLLIKKHPITNAEIGSITAVTRLGKNIFHYPAPSEAVDLNIVYYRKPTTLVSDEDEELDIEDDTLIIFKAALNAFILIEDAYEGNKPNTSFYSLAYAKQLETYEIENVQGQSQLDPVKPNTEFI